jgi:hypothetical protein
MEISSQSVRFLYSREGLLSGVLSDSYSQYTVVFRAARVVRLVFSAPFPSA